MIVVVYAMFTITIKDLKMRFSNSNLSLRKCAILFLLLVQKEGINKQIAGIP